MRYSSMALQMGITIAAGAWAGSELDKRQQMEKPIWTIVFSLLAVGISLYLVIRSVNRLSDED
jgi:membrane protein DedA with SNARE-associated domain